jgi:D-xylose transport system substrate-binding protein
MSKEERFMKKKGMAILIMSLMLGLCSSCGTTIESETETSTEENLKIGMAFDSFVIERWQKDRDVFVATAKELGAEVNIQNANGETAEQIAQIEYFIQEKMDVIVVIAIDADALTDVIGQAKERGIKIISYDRLVSDANADLYISFDNEEVGRLMADYIIEENPQGGNIIVVYGSKTDKNVEMVQTGFMEKINRSNITIIHEGYCDGWKPELAYGVVNEGLEVTSDIVGVVCGNDDLASSAVEALAGKRLAGDVTLVGQDGDLLACQRIVEGTQGMTVYKPVEELAAAAATYAVMLAKGELIPMEKTINDGTYEIPYIRLEPIAVTIDNIDEVIIQNGIHNEDEVYLNVNP